MLDAPDVSSLPPHISRMMMGPRTSWTLPPAAATPVRSRSGGRRSIDRAPVGRKRPDRPRFLHPHHDGDDERNCTGSSSIFFYISSPLVMSPLTSHSQCPFPPFHLKALTVAQPSHYLFSTAAAADCSLLYRLCSISHTSFRDLSFLGQTIHPPPLRLPPPSLKIVTVRVKCNSPHSSLLAHSYS